jgi:beta-fructofuranosidase
MKKLDIAREFIKQNKDKVNEEYRLGYHAMAEVGWINDPNGFCYYNGEYHLFYQYHPFSSAWGPMHWGHVKSKDLIKWEHMPVALAPDMYYDAQGCFSGSAIEDAGKLYLMYTGNVNGDPENPESNRQIQNIAVSEDGIEFTKIQNNPVISTKDLPEHALPQDFRDPKIFKHEGIFYSIIGSRHEDSTGQLLLYKSENLEDWSYVGVLYHSRNQLGKMLECPDFFRLQDKDVIIMSPQYLERDGDRYNNLHSCVYMLGDMDLENCKYDFDVVEQIDYGFDFYAPQTLVDDKGRRIMIAWMQMWERSMPTHVNNHGWSGAMTLPRELKIINGKVYQLPVEEVKNFRTNLVSYEAVNVQGNLSLEGVAGQAVELELEIDALKANTFGINVLKGGTQQTVIHYDRTEGKLILDRSQNGADISGSEVLEFKDIRKAPVSLVNNKLKLRIFIDRSSVEVFVQDGEIVMTATVYPDAESKNIEFFTDDSITITNLNKWDINK